MTKTLKNKDISTTVIGIGITVLLYVINAIVIDTLWNKNIDGSFYPLVSPVIFIALAIFFGYYTKRKCTKKSFIAIYITLIIPIVGASFAYFLDILPFKHYFLSMAYTMSYLINEGGLPAMLGISTSEAENIVMISIIAFMLITVAIAPITYRFTKPKTT